MSWGFWRAEVLFSYWVGNCWSLHHFHTLRGHSTTTLTKFYPILATYPLKWTIVDILHSTTYTLVTWPNMDFLLTAYLPTPSCPRRYWMTPKLSLGVTFVEFLGGLASDSKQNSMKLIQTTPVKRQALSNEISLWHLIHRKKDSTKFWFHKNIW